MCKLLTVDPHHVALTYVFASCLVLLSSSKWPCTAAGEEAGAAGVEVCLFLLRQHLTFTDISWHPGRGRGGGGYGGGRGGGGGYGGGGKHTSIPIV